MMKSVAFLIIAGALFAMAANRLDRSEISIVEIDNHIFHVPDEYVEKATVFYLPSTQSEGFTFIVNPKAEPAKRHIVSIESASVRCGHKHSSLSSQLARVCAAVAGHDDGIHSGQDFVVEKVFQHGYASQWQYHLKSNNGINQDTIVLHAQGFQKMKKRGHACRSITTNI